MVSAQDVKTILVVGAGTMGHGIAEVAAIAGYKVYVADINDEILRSALENQVEPLQAGREGADQGER
jgi:3-hydroxyacyl-CoA dehydrogenase